jgi:hypothetical protein
MKHYPYIKTIAFYDDINCMIIWKDEITALEYSSDEDPKLYYKATLRQTDVDSVVKRLELTTSTEFRFSLVMLRLWQRKYFDKIATLFEKELDTFALVMSKLPHFSTTFPNAVAYFEGCLQAEKEGKPRRSSATGNYRLIPFILKFMRKVKSLKSYPTALGICLRRRGTSRLVTQLILKNYMGQAQTP